MCTKPVIHPPKPAVFPKERHSLQDLVSLVENERVDLENAYALTEVSGLDTIHDASSFKDLTFSQITDQIWHFSSVDYGRRCMSTRGMSARTWS